MNWDKLSLYEQPINELARVCLRFEQLFCQLAYSIRGESSYDSRFAINAILEIVTLADRPDLKAGLAKEMSRLITNLNQLQQVPHVNHIKLNTVLEELDNAITDLNTMHGKFAHKLRKNEFLNGIRLQLVNPGGISCINYPALNHWLHQSYPTRKHQLNAWIEDIEDMREMVHLFLRIVRDSGHPILRIAQQGFYELNLDPKQPTQLIRVYLPETLAVYPEISVGRHRLCIRFLKSDFNDRAALAEADISFKLSCCII